MDDCVVSITYGNITEVTTRNKAIKKYAEGAISCDGTERDLYADILAALLAGHTFYPTFERDKTYQKLITSKDEFHRKYRRPSTQELSNFFLHVNKQEKAQKKRK